MACNKETRSCDWCMAITHLSDGKHPLMFCSLIVGTYFKWNASVSTSNLKGVTSLSLIRHALDLRLTVQNQLPLKIGKK